VWEAPRTAGWRARRLAALTRAAAGVARAVVVMTEEQARQARSALGPRIPVLRFTWGIDCSFYRHAASANDVSSEVGEVLNALLGEPYFILAGDQLRLDEDAVALVEKHGLRIVRVPQERHTADWYRRQIRERSLEGRLFVFEKVDYPTLRFLLQRATAYVGLVDSTWQPAGWTVMCESLASETPAIVYDGLTAREIRLLGARECVRVVPHADVAAVARSCEELMADRSGSLRAKAAGFSTAVLGIERTAADFVKEVERVHGA
jgi:glycosyltransferase involved in cell wall biosynthesis